MRYYLIDVEGAAFAVGPDDIRAALEKACGPDCRIDIEEVGRRPADLRLRLTAGAVRQHFDLNPSPDLRVGARLAESDDAVLEKLFGDAVSGGSQAVLRWFDAICRDVLLDFRKAEHQRDRKKRRNQEARLSFAERFGEDACLAAVDIDWDKREVRLHGGQGLAVSPQTVRTWDLAKPGSERTVKVVVSYDEDGERRIILCGTKEFETLMAKVKEKESV